MDSMPYRSLENLNFARFSHNQQIKYILGIFFMQLSGYVRPRKTLGIQKADKKKDKAKLMTLSSFFKIGLIMNHIAGLVFI
jgi:hypothetical protein